MCGAHAIERICLSPPNASAGMRRSRRVYLCELCLSCIYAQVLLGADKAELNFILARVNGAALVEVAGAPTMDLLASSRQRLPELTIMSRCGLCIMDFDRNCNSIICELPCFQQLDVWLKGLA